MTSTYTADLLDMSGSTVVSDFLTNDDASELRMGFALNGIPTIQVTVPTMLADVTQANFEPGKRQIVVKQDGTPVWGGYLLAATSDFDFATFTGKGYEFALTQRLISTNDSFLATEQLDIAWNLINDFCGDMGFTRASATASGVVRDVPHCCNDLTTVWDAIEALAGADQGFDFWITAGKAWTTAFPYRGTDRSATVIFDDLTNISAMQFAYDAETVANRLWFVPPQFDECGDMQMRDYGGTPDPDWIREIGEDMQDVPNASDRNDIATEDLRNSALPRIQPKVTIDAQTGIEFGDFDLGDTVHLTTSRGYMTMDTDMKVIDYEVIIANRCVQQVTATLDNVVTA
jgi:hypothetical protein